MEEKLSPLFSLKELLSEEEASKMGRKDPEEEVEKFVSANTQELGKDKWLCPLSGKKFKVSASKDCTTHCEVYDPRLSRLFISFFSLFCSLQCKC